MKKNKGITLIALVLTIIVLLILAGVTIATLIGDNGILSQAQNASEVTEIAQVEEGLQLEYSNVLIGKHAGNQDITDEAAILEEARQNYNTRYPERMPITKETVGGAIVINNVTIDKSSLQIGVDKANSGNIGKIKVTVTSSSNGGEKYFAQVKGKKYEVEINNGIISVAKTPATTSGSGELVITANVADNTIAEASVGQTVATENGSETEITVTGKEKAGNTTINITVNNDSQPSVALVAKASLLPGGTADATETDNYTDTAGKMATVPKGYTVSNTDGEKLISQGLVIRKGSDEYVWIEVPRTGGPNYTAVANTTVDSDSYYEAIEDALIAYAGFAKDGTYNWQTKRCGWKDEWYDSTSHTYDGTSWHNYDGTVNGSYSGNLEDTYGCGLSYTAYNTQYKKMLKSVYTNGGFWIGRYEGSSGGTNVAPLSQSGKTAQTLNCSNAQIAAARVATSDTGNTGANAYTSSLMFGVQWDLVCKFLEESTEWKNAENEPSWYIKTDSTSWGVYTGQNGPNNTGASGYKRMNIYDFAGNQWEWTLEHATSISGSACAGRGGLYSVSGSDHPASCRDYFGTSGNGGFRVSLY